MFVVMDERYEFDPDSAQVMFATDDLEEAKACVDEDRGFVVKDGMIVYGRSSWPWSKYDDITDVRETCV